MITLKSPVSRSVSILGFTPIQYTDVPDGGLGYVSAVVKLHLEGGKDDVETFILWDAGDKPAVVAEGVELEAAVAKANKYSDAGQWTDETAEVRIAECIAEKYGK